MTTIEALKILKELYAHQKKFKETCDYCVPDTRLEALLIAIEALEDQVEIEEILNDK